MSAVVIFDHVYKSFGRINAIEDVSLEVRDGELIALVGPNGAGKTTLLKLAAGVLLPDRGFVRIYGVDAHKPNAKRHVGFMTPMDRGVYWRLTAVDNLIFFGALYGMSIKEAKERAWELLGELGLRDRANDWVATYSTGMMRRLEVARALIHDPDVLLLDEPTGGIDVDGKRYILNFIRKLRGVKTIIIASHDPQEIELADRIIYLNRRIINESPALKIVKVLVKGSVNGLSELGFGVESIGGDEYIITTEISKFNDLIRRLASLNDGIKVLDVDVEVAVAESNARRTERIMRRGRGDWG